MPNLQARSTYLWPCSCSIWICIICMYIRLVDFFKGENHEKSWPYYWPYYCSKMRHLQLLVNETLYSQPWRVTRGRGYFNKVKRKTLNIVQRWCDRLAFNLQNRRFLPIFSALSGFTTACKQGITFGSTVICRWFLANLQDVKINKMVGQHLHRCLSVTVMWLCIFVKQ